MRLVLSVRVAGEHPPQTVTDALLEYADAVIVGCPYSLQLPAVAKWRQKYSGTRPCGIVYGGTDLSRVANVRRRHHRNFNVGYIGTLAFVKLHPAFVAMSAAVRIRDARFLIYGRGGAEDCKSLLRSQARAFNASKRFRLMGYVEDIAHAIGAFDVYGYPLTQETYAASESNLQEVMFAGVVPIVFPHGGVRDLVVQGETGLVVDCPTDYTAGLEYLYFHPYERTRMGHNAREHARQHFGAVNAARAIVPIYEASMHLRKRQHRWKQGDSVEVEYLYKGRERRVAAKLRCVGATMFVEGLGKLAAPYRISMAGNECVPVLDAERVIAEAAKSELMASSGYGSALHYRKYYPDDPFLALWSGLMLYHQERYAEASVAFSTAIEHGLDEWRVSWYLQCASVKCGSNRGVVSRDSMFGPFNVGGAHKQEAFRRLVSYYSRELDWL